MLPEAVLRAYRKAQEDYKAHEGKEGFYDSQWRDAAKKTMDALWGLFIFVLAIFLFFILPLAIYYILACGSKHGLSKITMVMLILLLFLPEIGFVFAVAVVIYGFMSCGGRELSWTNNTVAVKQEPNYSKVIHL